MSLNRYFRVQEQFSAIANRLWQGVCTDGEKIYALTDRDASFGRENIISIYDFRGNLLETVNNAYTNLDSTGKQMSFGDGNIIDGHLWCTAYNFNSVHPNAAAYESRMVRYDLADWSMTEWDIGGQTAEGVDLYDGDYWVVYHDLTQIKRYSLTRNGMELQQTYNLPIATVATSDRYQGLKWINGDLFCNLHGTNDGSVYAYGLDWYSFSGTSFSWRGRLTPPTAGAGQGFDYFRGRWLFADRPANQIILCDADKHPHHTLVRDWCQSRYQRADRTATMTTDQIRAAIDATVTAKRNTTETTWPEPFNTLGDATDKAFANSLAEGLVNG